jgi:hypothetical protein
VWGEFFGIIAPPNILNGEEFQDLKKSYKYDCLYKSMKIIVHKEADLEKIAEKRLEENFLLSHDNRIKKAFQLMKLSLMFKNESIKKPQGKGLLLKF